MIDAVCDAFVMGAVLCALLLTERACVVIARDRARPCPAGWYVNGVRPSGSFECRPTLGRPENDILDAVRRTVINDTRSAHGWLVCTGGARPILVDGYTVGCQR